MLTSRITLPREIAEAADKLLNDPRFETDGLDVASGARWTISRQQPRDAKSRLFVQGDIRIANAAFAAKILHAVSTSFIRVLQAPRRIGVVLDAPVVVLRTVPTSPLQVHANTLISFVRLDKTSIAPESRIRRIAQVGCAGNHPILDSVPIWRPPVSRCEPTDPAFACTLKQGFTVWHLAAAELLPHQAFSQLLADCLPVTEDTIHFDLRECCRTIPSIYLGPDTSLSEIVDWPREEVEEIFAFRSPPEISAMLGRRFLEGYADVLASHPLNAALARMLADCGWKTGEYPITPGAGATHNNADNSPFGSGSTDA